MNIWAGGPLRALIVGNTTFDTQPWNSPEVVYNEANKFENIEAYLSVGLTKIFGNRINWTWKRI